MAVSPDGSRLCTGSDDATIIIWDLEEGSFLASNNMHELRVMQVIFVQDFHQLISMSADKLIKWNMNGTSEVAAFRRTRPADFICVKLCNNEPSRFLAAATTDNIITIWNIYTAEIVLSLPGHNE